MIKMRSLLPLVFALVLTSPCFGQIAFDAVANSSGVDETEVSSLTFPLTVTAGNNRLVYVGVSIKEFPALTVSSVTYKGVALTNIRSDGSSYHTSIWYLVTPDTGTNDVVVNLSGTAEAVHAGAMSLSGVDPTNPVDAHNGAAGSDVTPTVDVTTVADNAWVLDTVVWSNANVFAVVGGGQTERWNGHQYNASGAGSTEGPKTPAGAVTMSWTLDPAMDWSISAASFKPYAAGGATKRRVVISD
jgi:hypothetical protein